MMPVRQFRTRGIGTDSCVPIVSAADGVVDVIRIGVIEVPGGTAAQLGVTSRGEICVELEGVEIIESAGFAGGPFSNRRCAPGGPGEPEAWMIIGRAG